MKDQADGDTQPIKIKVDLGSKTTGIAVVGEFPQQGRVVLLGINPNHRGAAIRQQLSDRRAIRHGRRGRKTRYRPALHQLAHRWLAPVDAGNPAVFLLKIYLEFTSTQLSTG